MRERSDPRLAGCLAAALAIAGCAAELHPVAEYAAPSGSIAPELNLGADHRVYLSWLQRQQDGHRLRYATLDERGWAGPHTAASGSGWIASESDWPALTAVGEGGLVAVWQRRRGSAGYASEIRIAFATDRGARWNVSSPLNDDGTTTEHGFVSLLPLNDRLHVIWLDGRHTTGGHGNMSGAAAMSLRHAVFDAQGTRLGESEVDARVCDCCHTAAARIEGGFIIAYRDRTDTEIRDVVVRRHVAGNWEDPVAVHEDGWKIEACPVNGPSIASFNSQVAVVWFSGSGNEPRVLAALSSDSGVSFGPPVRIDRGRAIGRVDVALLPEGDAVVTWTELEDNNAVIRLRRVSVDGSRGSARQLPAASPSGFPRMVSREGQLILAWTEKEDATSRVRAMVLPAYEL